MIEQGITTRSLDFHEANPAVFVDLDRVLALGLLDVFGLLTFGIEGVEFLEDAFDGQFVSVVLVDGLGDDAFVGHAGDTLLIVEAIKVDREERPDVDRIYMTFVQATTGGPATNMAEVFFVITE